MKERKECHRVCGIETPQIVSGRSDCVSRADQNTCQVPAPSKGHLGGGFIGTQTFWSQARSYSRLEGREHAYAQDTRHAHVHVRGGMGHLVAAGHLQEDAPEAEHVQRGGAALPRGAEPCIHVVPKGPGQGWGNAFSQRVQSRWPSMVCRFLGGGVTVGRESSKTNGWWWVMGPTPLRFFLGQKFPLTVWHQISFV